MASSKVLVDSHLQAQTAATRESNACMEPSVSGMSSTTVGLGDDASASLPELAAAEASELDASLGFFAVFCFLDNCWSLSAAD